MCGDGHHCFSLACGARDATKEPGLSNENKFAAAEQAGVGAHMKTVQKYSPAEMQEYKLLLYALLSSWFEV